MPLGVNTKRKTPLIQNAGKHDHISMVALKSLMFSPRHFADGIIMTLKCMNFFNLIRCSNYIVVHTVMYEGSSSI